MAFREKWLEVVKKNIEYGGSNKWSNTLNDRNEQKQIIKSIGEVKVL